MDQGVTPILTFFGEYRFLSNFWMATFSWDGVVWPHAEAAYQAAKTLDLDRRQEFVRMGPVEAKRAGKLVELRNDWDEVKVVIMHEIVFAKFDQNPHLKELLLQTGNRRLEEGNTWNDRVWGICPPGSNKGLNHLGQILMLVRAQLRGDIEL